MLRYLALVKNRRFGGTYSLHHQTGKIGELGTTLVVTSSLNYFHPDKRKPILSSETSVHTRATGRKITVGGILHNYSREILKPYIHRKPLIFFAFNVNFN
jgi:hypothetical protein